MKRRADNDSMDAISETFTRQPRDPSVLVVDGHAAKVCVEKGHLVIEDGMCGDRRKRRLSRVQQTVKRIVVIAHSGYISLEVGEWLDAVNQTSKGSWRKDPLTMTVLDPSGHLRFATARSSTNGALLRAQCHIRDTQDGLDVAKHLVSKKFRGHSDIHAQWDSAQWLAKLAACDDMDEVRETEAQESQEYFRQWVGLPVTFNCSIPDHWKTFRYRTSELNRKENRNATNPINALLNYCYGIAKAETAVACHIYGLEPTIGIMHVDYLYRTPLVFDLVEAVRPSVEQYVVDLVQTRTFTKDDFDELGNGRIRVLRPFTNELAEQAQRWHTEIAPVVQEVRSMINRTITGTKREWKKVEGTAKKAGRARKRR